MPSNKLLGGNTITDNDPLQTADPEIQGVRGSAAVTPDDDHDLPDGVTRGLYVGASGDVTMTMSDGTIVTRVDVAAGITHPWQVVRVWASGTDATGIIADY